MFEKLLSAIDRLFACPAYRMLYLYFLPGEGEFANVVFEGSKSRLARKFPRGTECEKLRFSGHEVVFFEKYTYHGWERCEDPRP